jgi:hypothetical protein
MDITNTIKPIDRTQWRTWLAQNHKTLTEIWLVKAQALLDLGADIISADFDDFAFTATAKRIARLSFAEWVQTAGIVAAG